MSLTYEYFIFVFVATCGVLQLAAAYAHLKGILFFRRTSIAYIFAILAIGGAFGWFFGWGNRLDEKIMHTGLEGKEQFLAFNLAALAAAVFTFILSSIINIRVLIQLKEGEEVEPGLSSLKQMSYLKALIRSFRTTKWKEEVAQGPGNLKQILSFKTLIHRFKTGKEEQ